MRRESGARLCSRIGKQQYDCQKNGRGAQAAVEAGVVSAPKSMADDVDVHQGGKGADPWIWYQAQSEFLNGIPAGVSGQRRHNAAGSKRKDAKHESTQKQVQQLNGTTRASKHVRQRKDQCAA